MSIPKTLKLQEEESKATKSSVDAFAVAIGNTDSDEHEEKTVVTINGVSYEYPGPEIVPCGPLMLIRRTRSSATIMTMDKDMYKREGYIVAVSAELEANGILGTKFAPGEYVQYAGNHASVPTKSDDFVIINASSVLCKLKK